jgi:uncharacterized protein (TIGR03435 family)
MILKVSALLAAAAGLFAQVSPQFEVASIRPSAPMAAGSQAGVRIDKGQFRATGLALRDYVMMAYELKSYQVEGPDWLPSERFDVQATIAGIPEGQTLNNKSLAAMVRPLLSERFALRAHHTQKDFPIYALVQMKDGILAREAPQDAAESTVAIGGSGSEKGTFINLGRGSSFAMGSNRIEMKKVSMSSVADILARFLDRPVMDQTGLSSTYDVPLEMTPEDFQALSIRAAVSAGVTLPPQALKLLESASGDSLHQALAKLGLKLESKKAPLNVLVIDSVNRSPSEN